MSESGAPPKLVADALLTRNWIVLERRKVEPVTVEVPNRLVMSKPLKFAAALPAPPRSKVPPVMLRLVSEFALKPWSVERSALTRLSVRPVTVVASIQLPPALLMLMSVRLTLLALVSWMPSPERLCKVPPLLAEPLPVMVRPPLPVALRRMPFGAPFALMLRKVRPAAPMVELATSSAVPVVVAIVLTIAVLSWVAVTVPPPVTAKAGLLPVVRLRPPVKETVAPPFAAKEIPLAVPLIGRVNETADAVRF